MSVIHRFEGELSRDDLSDHIWAVLCSVEDGFEKAGLVPGKDYSTQDLFAFARPIIESRFNNGMLGYTIATSKAGKE